MRRVLWANAAGLVLALVVGVLAARRPPAAFTPPIARTAAAPLSYVVDLPGGGQAVRDASDNLVPIRPYGRIVSGNAMTDRLLVALCEPDRVLAYSVYGARGPWAHQYAGKPTTDTFGWLEPIIALKPDLMVMNSIGAAGRVAQLRTAGIAVIDLGEMHGLATLIPSAERLAALLGAPERGQLFGQALTRRLSAVAAPLGQRPRRRALYLWGSGAHLFGATTGTSMHDVLEAAGLIDVAAASFRGWPQYSTEELLALAPELLVTKEGVSRTLCGHAALARFEACKRGAVIELPPYLVDEPGPAMLDAAELLFDRAYPGVWTAPEPGP